MAQSATKGGSSAGSAAGSTLRTFVTQGLSFAAIAGGGMFAGPAMGIASGMMGGHHGMPTTTYVWALPGHTASYVMPTTRPKFDLEFGNIAGLDPDRYEPLLVHLPQTKDNYRLVGATKQRMSYMGPGQPQSMIDEERTPLQATRLGRGHMQLEPAAPSHRESTEWSCVRPGLTNRKRASRSRAPSKGCSIPYGISQSRGKQQTPFPRKNSCMCGAGALARPTHPHGQLQDFLPKC